MKIGYLIPEWPSQSHVWAWREISHLRELGLEVTILSTRPPKQINQTQSAFATTAEAEAFYLWPMSLRQIIITVLWALWCSPRGFLSCLQLSFQLPLYQKPAWRSVLPLMIPACRLAYELKHRQLDHIHTPMPANSAILCMMSKRLVGIPFSVTVVADFTHWGGAMQEKFAEAEFVALVGQWMVKQMPQDFPCLPASRYQLVRHGVDTQKWVPPTKSLSNDDRPPRIVSVGRLVPDKGFNTLLQALAIVKQQGLTFQLEIVGDGPERATLEALARDLELDSEVTFLGALSETDCLARMQAADIFALATRTEGLGIVFVEAMAVEVASIDTAVGGVVEIIENDVNGLLVPPDNVELLANAIVRLLTDPVLRKRLGKAGRQTVLQQFDSRQGASTLRDLILKSHGLAADSTPGSSAKWLSDRDVIHSR